MTNHFHLVTETPRANLVAGMQWFLGVYTNRFNHRHKEFGHLFSGRYKALPVDASGNGYLKSVCSRMGVRTKFLHISACDNERPRALALDIAGPRRILAPAVWLANSECSIPERSIT